MIRRRLPLWAQWSLALIVFAVIGVVLLQARRSTNSPSSRDRAAAIKADRESRIVLRQDQAPHRARLRRGLPAERGLEEAIRADMRRRVRHGELSGPVERARCGRRGQSAAGRVAFRCSALVGGVNYPFLGVVGVSARQVTWCKRDPPAVPGGGDDVPVSPRCLR